MDGGFDGSLWISGDTSSMPAALDWVGCCDHDNGGGREYTWWIDTEADGHLSTRRASSRPCSATSAASHYPEGHRNVLFVQRGVRTLPRLP